MATWQDLDAELDLWHSAGERPTFWWRDDDCESPTDALRQLIALSGCFAAPLHLAIIPAQIDPALAALLAASPHVWCMQHGFAHKNHEPKGLRASEVGVSRELSLQEGDLRTGWQRMLDAGLPNMTPVFVPPWNRIGAQVVPYLSNWGFAALSGFDKRCRRAEPDGLLHFNGHVEPLRWRPDAQFAGTGKTLEQCVVHLRERRSGVVDKDEPTGLVTHHLQTPQDVWDFCESFAERLQGRVDWIALHPLLKDR